MTKAEIVRAQLNSLRIRARHILKGNLGNGQLYYMGQLMIEDLYTDDYFGIKLLSLDEPDWRKINGIGTTETVTLKNLDEVLQTLKRSWDRDGDIKSSGEFWAVSPSVLSILKLKYAEAIS
tara:strand:+ start:223 stop:585 length:363 start_codon:yes stop_codon:yes gene_type:complete